MKPTDETREWIGSKRIENSNSQHAGLHVGDVLHDRPRPLDIGKDPPRRIRERRARRSDPQLPSSTIEQLDAQITFENTDRLRQRRLRDEQRPRGLGDAAVIGHGDEVLGVPDIHHASLASGFHAGDARTAC